MRTEPEDKARHKRAYLQLSRLERLTDVVYALVIWRAFALIPKPTTDEWSGEALGAFLTDNVAGFITVFIAIAVAIIYWLQNNTLFGNLERTDTRHTALSILQIFFLLLFLLSIKLGVELGGSLRSRVFESATAALVGITGGWAWSYAIKDRRLMLPEVTDSYARQLQDRILAEPITATLTILLAFVGPIIWEVGWLSYPLFVFLVRRRRKSRQSVE
jgi:uncharacterized membrane protein